MNNCSSCKVNFNENTEQPPAFGLEPVKKLILTDGKGKQWKHTFPNKFNLNNQKTKEAYI